MKILVFFPFSPEQIADFTDLAGSLSDHEVLHADSEEEASRLAPGCEVILGHFPKSVTDAAGVTTEVLIDNTAVVFPIVAGLCLASALVAQLIRR